jgi:hypothetical protein
MYPNPNLKQGWVKNYPSKSNRLLLAYLQKSYRQPAWQVPRFQKLLAAAERSRKRQAPRPHLWNSALEVSLAKEPRCCWRSSRSSDYSQPLEAM